MSRNRKFCSGAFLLLAWSWMAGGDMVTAAELTGLVQRGGTGTPRLISGATVTLYEATTDQPVAVGTATTDDNGEFSITTPSNQSSSIFFVSAEVKRGVEYVAILGPTLPTSVTINELTTVAASYSMAQFYRTGVIAGEAFALQIAAGMNDNLVDVVTGESSSVMLSSPNADQTHSLRMTRGLSNLLAVCSENFLLRWAFLGLTKPAIGLPARSLPEAMANLARDPGQNVVPIFLLSKLRREYEPSLLRIPDAWTVTVKVNDSGDDSRLFGGPAAVVFDDKGYAWVANNVIQGQPVSCNYIMVLKPNGQPADGTNNTPISPVTGGGLLGPGLGITIDPSGSIWVGNFGWGGVNPTLDGNGSVSQFSPQGAPISGDLGYQGGPVRVQGIKSDADGNIWMCSYGTNSVFVFPQGSDANPIESDVEYLGSRPFDVALTSNGEAWVTNGGGFKGLAPSSIVKYELVDGALQRKFIQRVGKALKMVTLDSSGNAWVASQGDSTVYAFQPDGRMLGAFTGGGINGPWGMAVDGDDNIWVGNFGPLEQGSNFTRGGLTKLCGTNPRTRPLGSRTGDPLSPRTGYTVHSAGEEVLLHDLTPLYGADGPKSFAPLMRSTGVSIDQAGNVWVVNNWKPNFEIDNQGGNPGGDGIVIFVGLAKPPAK